MRLSTAPEDPSRVDKSHMQLRSSSKHASLKVSMAKSGTAMRAYSEQESAPHLNMWNKPVISQKHPIIQSWKRNRNREGIFKIQKKFKSQLKIFPQINPKLRFLLFVFVFQWILLNFEGRYNPAFTRRFPNIKNGVGGIILSLSWASKLNVQKEICTWIPYTHLNTKAKVKPTNRMQYYT